MHKPNTKWLPLFLTNFLGVLNDNFLKNLIAFVGIMWLADESNKALVISLASAMMVLPYILFSPVAGRLSKKYPKARIIKYTKVAEIPIMMLAAVGFYFKDLPTAMTAMFFMGLQSCMYSPAKYGIIRDIGGKEGISFGTGAMEMLTFTAVLIGTYLAGTISDIINIPRFAEHPTTLIAGIFLFISVAGLISSLFINPKENDEDTEEDASLNPVTFTIQSFRWSKKIKGLNYSIFGLSTFWLIGSLIQMNIIIYGPGILKLSNTDTSIIMALVAIGIGLGCYLAGVISNHKVKTSLIPLGGIGMLISILLILILDPGPVLFSVLVVSTAFFAGFFKIPLNAFMQDRVRGRMLTQVLAYNNLMVFLFILISAGIFGLVEKFSGARGVFVVTAIIIAFVTVVMYLKIPGAGKKQTAKDDQ
jgi:acyl-[acyl-carrier-protein]-phospholipid O-acyltransferase/long-chain-fatty-acid--[acyl-carrier-protein] ligase